MKRKPRKGPAYPVTKEWQEWVRDRIEQMKGSGGLKSQNELAERAGISKASLSEALSDEAVETRVMPQIHTALGWPPPLVALHPDVLEMVHSFMGLSDVAKGQFFERMRQAVEEERARAARSGRR